MSGMEDEPERGGALSAMFTLRLSETARYAAEHGFTLFTTTLASSRWKSLNQINLAGRRAAALYPAPSSGNRTGEKEDYKIAEINFLKSMTSTINNIAVASSVCGGLKRKNKTSDHNLYFSISDFTASFFKVILKEHGIIILR